MGDGGENNSSWYWEAFQAPNDEVWPVLVKPLLPEDHLAVIRTFDLKTQSGNAVKSGVTSATIFNHLTGRIGQLDGWEEFLTPASSENVRPQLSDFLRFAYTVDPEFPASTNRSLVLAFNGNRSGNERFFFPAHKELMLPHELKAVGVLKTAVESIGGHTTVLSDEVKDQLGVKETDTEVVTTGKEQELNAEGQPKQKEMPDTQSGLLAAIQTMFRTENFDLRTEITGVNTKITAVNKTIGESVADLREKVKSVQDTLVNLDAKIEARVAEKVQPLQTDLEGIKERLQVLERTQNRSDPLPNPGTGMSAQVAMSSSPLVELEQSVECVVAQVKFVNPAFGNKTLVRKVLDRDTTLALSEFMPAAILPKKVPQFVMRSSDSEGSLVIDSDFQKSFTNYSTFYAALENFFEVLLLANRLSVAVSNAYTSILRQADLSVSGLVTFHEAYRKELIMQKSFSYDGAASRLPFFEKLFAKSKSTNESNPKQRSQRSNSVSNSSLTCYRCKEKGHIAAKCLALAPKLDEKSSKEKTNAPFRPSPSGAGQ